MDEGLSEFKGGIRMLTKIILCVFVYVAFVVRKKVERKC
jgi:hypothetical protein